MNPGAAEEGVKVAGGIVEALRTQPLLLVLILFNIGVMTMIYFSIRETRSHEFELRKLNLEMLGKAQDLLSKCVNPENLRDRGG